MTEKKTDEPVTAASLLDDDAPAVQVAKIDDLETVMADIDADEGIDPNHPILSVEEQREAIKKARARVAADSKKEAIKAFEAQVYDKERGRTGLRTGDAAKDEPVSVTLDLAEHSSCITINGTPYWHGFTYTVPRHVADTLREVMSRGHDHQTDLDGKGLSERMRKPRLTLISERTGAVVNAPQKVA
jgi:hypothetical protein